MEGYTLKQLKGFKFEVIKDMFGKAFKRVNTFVDYKIELVEGSKKRTEDNTKRAGTKLEQEEVAIDAIPLATKLAPIVNFHIYRKGRNGYYEIMRADGSAKTYLLFSQMLKEFDREDFENLWKLVKAKHRNTRPAEGYESVLWGDLKTMLKHHIEDEVCRSLQGTKVLLWRLYNSCGVHFVRFEDMHVYMLVEKRYSLTPATITDMLNKKLKSDYWNEILLMKKLDDFEDKYQVLGRIVGIKSFIRLFGITAALIKVSVTQEERFVLLLLAKRL
ncbi:hypothetical protein Tco_0516508 [Tanacetum coccineum]